MDKPVFGGIDPHKNSITVGLVDAFGADVALASFDIRAMGCGRHWAG